MATEILMPKLGLTMTEGRISRWYKAEGDYVNEGEPLFDVETDKLTTARESDVSGVLLKIIVPVGDTVPCLTKVAYIGEAGEEIETASAPAAAVEATETKVTEQAPTAVENSVIVIGGGPGGYVAAFRAAQLGASVTLIESDKVGGTCLNRGCMPTKALLHSSEVYEQAKNSAHIGVVAKNVEVDWAQVQKNRAMIVEQLTGGVKGLIRKNKVKHIAGEAVFTGPKTVKVGDEVLTADKIIIATGSRPKLAPIPGSDESKACIDTTECLELDRIPESMLVVGGGVSGVELGSVYARFGTKVTLVEMMPRILPTMDGELTDMLIAQLEESGMNIMTGTQVLSIKDKKKGALATILKADGTTMEEKYEKILLCVGRTPNTEKLGLEKIGMRTAWGFIETNAKMETNIDGVYAIGDCNGKLMLAHAAMVMGEVAAENAMGHEAKFDEHTSPSCAYVGPEFAGVGFTEEELKERKIAYKVGKFPTFANGKSLVLGHTKGMIKVLAGERYGEVLGVHILAPQATDMITEAALAIKLEATLDELTDTIHPHPTVAEGLREAALAADGKAVHI